MLTYYPTTIDITGLGRPQTVEVDPVEGYYLTQSGMAGVLRIDSKGVQTRVAERLSTEPNDAVLDYAGNLYISDRSSVFRVGADGTEAQNRCSSSHLFSVGKWRFKGAKQ